MRNRDRRRESGASLGDELHRFVRPQPIPFTDEWRGYREPGQCYAAHQQIKRKDHVDVSGNVHKNTIIGFFGNLENGIRGNYHAVPCKWLRGYLNQYAWRYNHRKDSRLMVRTLVERAATVQRAAA